MSYDLIIKNGKVIDGSGIPGFYADIAVSGGRIVEIGQVTGDARQVLNADGLVVAPGIVDNHTHYDAQVTWDPLSAEKGGFNHFMLKEIFEQPQAVRDTMLGRVSLDAGEVLLDSMEISANVTARNGARK